MKVLIACEESQEVCKAFRAKGHEAYSCDLLPCSGGRPEWHLKGDCLARLLGGSFMTQGSTLVRLPEEWDLVIAFPPCTDLAVSGARWFPEKRANGSQQASIEFFMKFVHWQQMTGKKLAIENPIGIMSTIYCKPDQIIQPWQFGHGETKATCLWLHGLPKLVPTDIVEGREQRVWKMSPSPDRAKQRSKTFPGIAVAMADQWV